MLFNEITFDIGDYKKLENDEVIELFKQYDNGDLQAREKIINHNLKLVLNQVIKKFKLVMYDKDDLISIGMIGLIKAVDTFDISRKINFSTYAIKCINNEIYLVLRDLKKEIKSDSLNDIISTTEDANICLEDTLIDEDVNFVLDYEHKELILELNSQIEMLKDKEKEFVKMYFGFYDGIPKTLDEIGEIYNITRQRVNQVLLSAKTKIKRNLLQQNLIEKKESNCNKVKKLKI